MKKLFSQLNAVFLALGIGQLLFCAAAIYIRSQGSASFDLADDNSATLAMVTPFLALGAFAAAWAIHKMRVAQGAALKELAEKLVHYRTTVLLRAAMIEGGNIILLIVYLLNGAPIHLVWFGAGILFFAYFRPSPNAFVRDYQLPNNEERELMQHMK